MSDAIRQVNIRNLKAKLSKEFTNLPFEVTKNGKVIAFVAMPNVTTIRLKKNKSQNCSHNIKTQDELFFNPCPKTGAK